MCRSTPLIRAAELAYFIEDAEPAVIVAPGHLGLGDLRSEGAAFETVSRGPDDLAAILYTSGTTGRSKGAMLSHDNLASNALVLKDYWRWRAGDVLIHALPIYHVHGLFVALHGALLNGSTMLWHAAFDADAVIDDMASATILMGVPTFYTRLLANPRLSREAASAMRLFVSGSAPLLEATFADFEARTGHRILERYGMTEAGMICSNPYDGDRIPGTVGFPLPGVEARIEGGAGGRACSRYAARTCSRAIGATPKRPPRRCARAAGSSPAISRRWTPTAGWRSSAGRRT